MWRNETKRKYMLMFPLKNLARKGLTARMNRNVLWSASLSSLETVLYNWNLEYIMYIALQATLTGLVGGLVPS